MSLLMVDMDGTVRRPLSGAQYFEHPEDQQVIEGVQLAIRSYREQGLVLGITNQGGVAAGHKSLEECIREQQFTLHLLPELEEIYFCPDFQGRKCFRVTREGAHNHSKDHWSGQFRKPGAGMLRLAMQRHKQKPENCLYVGDRTEDRTAAQRAGVSFLWAEDWLKQHSNYLRISD
ncbi:MAG TPA: HAD-IIIA family hydrolase [Leptolyngbyaceae cyanobacterium]